MQRKNAKRAVASRAHKARSVKVVRAELRAAQEKLGEVERQLRASDLIVRAHGRMHGVVSSVAAALEAQSWESEGDNVSRETMRACASMLRLSLRQNDGIPF